MITIRLYNYTSAQEEDFGTDYIERINNLTKDKRRTRLFIDEIVRLYREDTTRNFIIYSRFTPHLTELLECFKEELGEIDSFILTFTTKLERKVQFLFCSGCIFEGNKFLNSETICLFTPISKYDILFTHFEECGSTKEKLLLEINDDWNPFTNRNNLKYEYNLEKYDLIDIEELFDGIKNAAT